jgi:hypothetical protein
MTSKIENFAIFEVKILILKPFIMRKLFIYLLVFVIFILISSCSKDDDILCDCTVITIEKVNYSISECAPDIFFDGRATPKQARIREAQDNCQ